MSFLKKIKNLVEICYYSFTEEPFEMDSVGYVEENKLMIPFDDFDTDEFLIVKADDDVYIVKPENVFTRVFKDERLVGNWGADYPCGGRVSSSKPTHQDDDGNFYIEGTWV